MSIPFNARLVDLANLIIAKGANFTLTALVFMLLSNGMDSQSFGEFGYWWSIAIMIGGVLLGGVSSALVRTAVLKGSLRQLTAPLRYAAQVLLAFATVFALTLFASPQWAAHTILFIGVALFGLAVQVQTALLALLRAVEATRSNVLASFLIVLLVPIVLFLMLGTERTLPRIFFILAFAFALGALAVLVSARRQLGPLFFHDSVASVGGRGFLSNALAFTAVNVFSFALINVDFTFFRFFGTPENFALMATCKVFFERFVVPVLMVFAGAISLRILRYQSGDGAAAACLEARISPQQLVASVMAVVLVTFAYWVFATEIRSDKATIPLGWVVCAAIGYLLYAVNGILFDLLVLRQSLAMVIAHVAFFLLLGAVLQIVAISNFGVPGWAVGWLVLNAVFAAVMAREGLNLHFVGRGSANSK